MEKYNHQVGLKIVGERLPQECNRVTLAEEKDQYGLPVSYAGFWVTRLIRRRGEPAFQ
jgi:hypothetical protein